VFFQEDIQGVKIKRLSIVSGYNFHFLEDANYETHKDQVDANIVRVHTAGNGMCDSYDSNKDRRRGDWLNLGKREVSNIRIDHDYMVNVGLLNGAGICQ